MSVDIDHVHGDLNEQWAHVDEDQPEVEGPFLHQGGGQLELLHEAGIQVGELESQEETNSVDPVVVVVHLLRCVDHAVLVV